MSNREHLDREKERPYVGDIAIIKVGTNLGARRKKNEVGSAPDALMRAGLVNAIERDVGAHVVEIVEIDCSPDPGDPHVDSVGRGGVINERGNIRVATNVAAEVEKQRKLNRRVIVLGGDHSISLGSVPGFVGAIKDTYGQDAEGGKVTIDAHGDLQNRDRSPSGGPHGMVETANYGLMDPADPLGKIHRADAKLKTKNGVTVGVNDFDTEPAHNEVELAEISAIEQYTRDRVNFEGLGKVRNQINAIRNRPEVKELLVSIDIDGLKEHATGMKNANGVTDSEMISLSKELSNGMSDTTPVTVIEIAEYTPGRDKNGRTAKFVRNQIVTLLGARPHQTLYERVQETRLWQSGLKVGAVAALVAASVIGPFVGYFKGKNDAGRPDDGLAAARQTDTEKPSASGLLLAGVAHPTYRRDFPGNVSDWQPATMERNNESVSDVFEKHFGNYAKEFQDICIATKNMNWNSEGRGGPSTYMRDQTLSVMANYLYTAERLDPAASEKLWSIVRKTFDEGFEQHMIKPNSKEGYEMFRTFYTDFKQMADREESEFQNRQNDSRA